MTTTSNRSGSNARSCTAALTESSSTCTPSCRVASRRERGDPRSIAADGRDACAAGARDVERAGERPLERRVEERAEERDRAAPVERDAVHARPEIELRLDSGEGGIRGCGDEDRLCAERRVPCGRRQRVPRLRERPAPERRVRLANPKPVQARDARERPARLRHDLGRDAVPGEAHDRVHRALGHVTGLPSRFVSVLRLATACSSCQARPKAHLSCAPVNVCAEPGA